LTAEILTPNRCSVHLREYDYAQPGVYFVTICAFERRKLFGKLVDFEVELSPVGRIVKDCWSSIPSMLSFVELDVLTIMPDHLHAILWIQNDRYQGEVAHPMRPPSSSGSLGRIINFFKGACTRTLKRNSLCSAERLWQRNYHEHVVRNQEDLDRIREYILDNPVRSYLKLQDGRSNGAPLQ
jgi:putative transposase